jgi:K+ transporter
LIAFAALVAAAFGTSFAYRERELVAGSAGGRGSPDTKTLVGAVALLFWLLVLVVAMRDRL